jgi:acetate kinase
LKILVLNSGSSSLKCQLFALDDGGGARVLARAAVERVGTDAAPLRFDGRGAEPWREELPCRTHLDGIRRVLELLVDAEHGVLTSLAEIEAVGHRVVHAGEAFTGSVAVTDAVLEALEACSHLAPLHNPPGLAGIRACAAVLPGVPQVCVFDNALHHTLPPEVFLYGLPRRFYTEHGVRRYGFHGVAFRSIVENVEAQLGRPKEELRIVSLMLGSGTTANGLDHGRSVAISTGFTPLEGLVQSTRCGDLDPGAVLALLRAGSSPRELSELFNRGSGLKGLSGISPDMRDIEAVDSDRARLTMDVFVHRCVKYVGAYSADMAGLDVLAFGGGIGQNAPEVRAAICAPLGHLGLRLDAARNAACRGGPGGIVSAEDSRVAVVVADVDEELVIAHDTRAVVLGS